MNALTAKATAVPQRIPAEEFSQLNSNDTAVLTADKRNPIRIGNLTLNIRSSFSPQKDLREIMFSIANARLKEKTSEAVVLVSQESL